MTITKMEMKRTIISLQVLLSEKEKAAKFLWSELFHYLSPYDVAQIERKYQLEMEFIGMLDIEEELYSHD